MSSFLDASGSFPGSAEVAAAASPSAGAAASPSVPSAVPSAGFSGSLTIVGGAIVATTKSLSVIVGLVLSGSFTDEIFTLARCPSLLDQLLYFQVYFPQNKSTQLSF